MKDITFTLCLIATWIGIVLVATRYEQLNAKLKEVIEHQLRCERIWMDGGY